MNPWLLLPVALAGGVGAVLRYLVDRACARRIPQAWVGTLVVNTSGSFALGLLTGFGSAIIPPTAMLVLGAGLLGAYTTFSTASFELFSLIRRREAGRALLHAIVMPLFAVISAICGVALGTALL